MPLNIKHPEADRLARELATVTGETLTQAILNALRERLDREKSVTRRPRAKDVLQEARQRLASCPILDPRPADEILGYDDRGLPH